MTALTANQEEFNLFKEYIHQHCSIALTDEKKYLLESRLTKLVVESGCGSFLEFYRTVLQKNTTDLRDKIIDAMTTNETLWFRDGSPWIALREKVLPELSEQLANDKNKKLRIWSAACSTGQEPYTIAMVIDDFCRMSNKGISPERFEIVATDISTSALFIAMAGRYDRISMNRGFTDEWLKYRARYFNTKGAISTIKDDIKKRITFKRFNLQDRFASLGHFDVVFVRNVAIYFSDEFKKDLYQRIRQAMNPKGYLFLGSAETLLGYLDTLENLKHGRAMYYRKSA